MPRGKKNGTNGKQPNGNGANLGFEQTLWAAADKMRGHMDAAEYKHVNMIQPYKGRVYDPCCCSGGMFMQSEKFVEAHGGVKSALLELIA
jgi:type I restriction-modification system DNA methylase subunit